MSDKVNKWIDENLKSEYIKDGEWYRVTLAGKEVAGASEGDLGDVMEAITTSINIFSEKFE